MNSQHEETPHIGSDFDDFLSEEARDIGSKPTDENASEFFDT